MLFSTSSTSPQRPFFFASTCTNGRAPPTCHAAQATAASRRPATYWQVRPMDKPCPGDGVPGVMQGADIQAFLDQPGTAGLRVVTTSGRPSAVAVNGASLRVEQREPAPTTRATTSPPPVFALGPRPRCRSYRVYVAPSRTSFQGGNFDFMSTTNTAVTQVRRVRRRLHPARDDYYWYVQACGPRGYGTSASVWDPPLPSVASFRKKSPPAIRELLADNLDGRTSSSSGTTTSPSNNVADL